MRKENMKQAGYLYIGYSYEHKAHVLKNVWNKYELWGTNKNHASYGLLFKNTHLEFLSSLDDKAGNDFAFSMALRHTGRPQRIKDLFKELCEDYNPKHDPWGYTMALAFDIGAAMSIKGLRNVLDYHAGAGGHEFNDPYTRRRLMRLGNKRLERLAEFTRRLLALLEREGRAY